MKFIVILYLKYKLLAKENDKNKFKLIIFSKYFITVKLF